MALRGRATSLELGRSRCGGVLALAGATTKELMTRLGHSSPRAAMIYQHATRERDKSIAAALGKLLDATRDGAK